MQRCASQRNVQHGGVSAFSPETLFLMFAMTPMEANPTPCRICSHCGRAMGRGAKWINRGSGEPSYF